MRTGLFWIKQYCCTIHNFKKWGGIENLKRFVSLKGKREVKTIADLMDAVIECGYSRELDYFEYRDIENDSLLENSDYKCSIDELFFYANEKLHRGFEKLESPRYELQIGKYNDTEINFYLDLCIGGIRKDLPDCILKEIERETNELLEVNFVRLEDIKKTKFICYAKVKLSHTVDNKTLDRDEQYILNTWIKKGYNKIQAKAICHRMSDMTKFYCIPYIKATKYAIEAVRQVNESDKRDAKDIIMDGVQQRLEETQKEYFELIEIYQKVIEQCDRDTNCLTDTLNIVS